MTLASRCRLVMASWRVWLTTRRVRRAYPEIACIPKRPRAPDGKFASPTKMARAALHNRLRKELA
jgi:hypothetical protein